MRKRTGIAILAAACLLAAGCSATDGAGGASAPPGNGSSVTVIDNQAESVYAQPVKLEQIDRLEGVRGMDWLSEEELVVGGPDPEPAEGREQPWQHLYIRNLATDQDTPLVTGERNVGAALLSPNKRHLFFKELFEATGIPYLLDLQTMQEVRAGEGEISGDEGEWAGNEHVVYSLFPASGDIVFAGLDGRQETVVRHAEGGYTHGAVQGGRIIYYLAGDRLVSHDLDSGENGEGIDGVEWIVPSPDGKRLAVVRLTGEAERSLLLCDAAGNELSTLAVGTQIFGANWSPDGTRLAYTVSSDDGSLKGLFIAEAESGDHTQIGLDIDHVSDKLRWSPSGQKLLAATSMPGPDGYRFVTYILTFS